MRAWVAEGPDVLELLAWWHSGAVFGGVTYVVSLKHWSSDGLSGLDFRLLLDCFGRLDFSNSLYLGSSVG